MKALVILSNSGGVLAREEIEVPGDAETHDADALDMAATNVIEGWTLSIGDTITIVDADETVVEQCNCPKHPGLHDPHDDNPYIRRGS